jgi:hypothetical protein
MLRTGRVVVRRTVRGVPSSIAKVVSETCTSKGVVERRNGFFETSFIPGRDFTSPADFNIQFCEWLTRASTRVVRTIKMRSVELLDADKAAMMPLPPVPQPAGWMNRVRLGRDYYVRIDASDYSVDPAVIGRLVNVTADLERVQMRLDGRVPYVQSDGHLAPRNAVWATFECGADVTVGNEATGSSSFSLPRLGF